MPGIVGIIRGGPSEKNTGMVQQMVKCMMHEPFSKSEIYQNSQLEMEVGWVGHNGSFSDCMPVWNEAKDICLIFSGENYADQSEIDHLRAKGHQFEAGDASYLVHLYEEFGFGFFEKLNGRFSGVLVDLRENKCILFNDRFGFNRIYQYDTEHGFYFASEAKSLLKVLPELRQLDMNSFAEFFSCGCPLQNRSLFQGVSLFPGGSAWTFSPGRKVKKQNYFNKEIWENQEPLGIEEYHKKLKETWVHILPRYFAGKEKLAVSLTGGKDSRMIMAWENPSPNSLPCYTFGGMYRDCLDVKLARSVAKICHQPHEVIPVDKEFLSQFSTLAEKTVYITDGALGVGGATELFVNGKARQIAPVRMTGNYGQEVLRSAVAFKPNPHMCEGPFQKEFSKLIRSAAQTYHNELHGNSLSFVIFKQVPWHHYCRLSIELSQLTVRSPYLDNDLVSIAFQTPPELIQSIEPQLRLIFEGNQAMGNIGTDRGMRYRSTPLATKLSNFYQEFTFKAEYAYDYGMPHWLARIDHVFKPLHLERLFLGRHKFYHFRVWYRDQLSQYIKEILLDPRTLARPYLDSNFVEKIVKDHTTGKKNYTNEIQQILSSELIQRTLIERNWE